MKILKIIVNIIFSLLLTILILGNLIVNIFSNTVLNQEYVYSMLEKSEYYEKMQVDLKNEFDNYKYQSGLSEQVFENLYTIDMLKKDTNSIIDNIYNGTEISNSSETVKTRIEENVNTYLKENNIVLNEVQQKNVNEFQKLIIKAYEDEVTISNQILKPIIDFKSKIDKVIIVFKKALFISLIAIIIFAILLNIKSICLFFNTVWISLLSAGSLLVLAISVVYGNININSILVITQTFSDFIKEILNNILLEVKSWGISFIIIGIIGILINNYFIAKQKQGK